MAIVLSILGKILYVLVILLCILLLLVGVVLFCPVHYKVSLEKGEEFTARGAVRWLFFLLYCPFSFEENQFRYEIRICGIKWKPGKKKEPKEKKSRRRQNVPEEKEQSGTEDAGPVKDILIEPESTEGKEVPEKARLEEKQPEAEENLSEAGEEQPESGKKKRKKRTGRKQKSSGEQKKSGGFSDVGAILVMLREKTDFLSKAIAFLKEDNTKQMICIIKDNVVHLIKKVKPKVLKGYIEFGTGDPCQTGQVLGGLACLYAYYGRKVEIVPDFTEKKLLGHLYIRGRFSLITFVMILIRLMISEGWSRFVNDIKELKEAL